MLKAFDAPVNRWSKSLNAITDQLDGKFSDPRSLAVADSPSDKKKADFALGLR
jgi:hypothetical protein